MPQEFTNIKWPGWETGRLIGRGSFGAVYEIEREVFGHKEKAALKVITIPQSDSDIDDLMSDGYDEESITKRFEGYLHDIVREYSMMADMKGCANIVYCDDVKYIQHDNGMGWDIFIKMELLSSLPRALSKTVLDEQVIKVGADICSALAFCEKRNLLHRDIKPQNIFIAPDGTYKLGDFGIAKTAERTTSGTKTGTYKYMAPEVYNNQPYGGKADIYSLGLVLYWLLNERRTPFLPLPPATPTSTEEDKARARRFAGETIPAPAHGSEELKRIVLKACAYAPKDRYQSAEEMLQDLDALSGGSRDVAAAAMIHSGEARSATDGKAATAHTAYIDAAPSEDETVSAYGLEKKEGIKSEEETVGVFAEKPRVSKKDKPKKRGSLPVLIGIAAVLALVVCFFTVHRWSEASCTEPAKCMICGKTSDSPLGHSWNEATCTDAKICTQCGEATGSPLGHSWKEATCTNAKTCTQCGETTGSSLGHSWKAATCTTAKTCTRCGETSGSSLGHSWKAATCTTAKTCTRCGETSGSPLGHSWKEATYDSPKTCSICGLTTGTALERVPTSWVEGNWTWSLEGGHLTISGSGNMGNFEWDGSPWYDQCKTITRVIVEEGITGIGTWAFAYCENLSSVSLPSSLSFIGNEAFFNCTNRLTTLEIPEGVTYIGEGAFARCWSLETISIPSSLIALEGNPFACCTALTQIKIGKDNPCLKVVDGVLFSKDMQTLFYYFPKNGGTVYVIPSSVTSIANEAFYECRKLTSVVIPEGVTDIGSCTFIYCSGLTNIWIPESVTFIGSSAFACCNSLADVFYSGSESQWCRLIGDRNIAELNNSCTIHFGSD